MLLANEIAKYLNVHIWEHPQSMCAYCTYSYCVNGKKAQRGGAYHQFWVYSGTSFSRHHQIQGGHLSKADKISRTISVHFSEVPLGLTRRGWILYLQTKSLLKWGVIIKILVLWMIRYRSSLDSIETKSFEITVAVSDILSIPGRIDKQGVLH